MHKASIFLILFASVVNSSYSESVVELAKKKADEESQQTSKKLHGSFLQKDEVNLDNTITLVQADGSQLQFDTIQQAIDRAIAGDRILLGNGVYSENVVFVRSGTAENSISLGAMAGTNPIIDGADPSLQKPSGTAWQQDPELPGVYFAEVPYSDSDALRAICTFVSRYGVPSEYGCDRLLSPYASLEALNESPRGEGSFREGDQIYVKLADGQNPNEVGLSVGRARGVVDTMNHSNLEISGITVRNGGWAGICLSGSSFENIVIDEVTVENSFRGISITEAESATDLLIKSCKIYNGFDRSWTRNGGYTAGLGAHPQKRWSDQLSPYRGFGIRVDGEYIDIENCRIAGNWDAISVRGHFINIHHNTISHIIDDAIEMESRRSSEIQVYNNHIYDVYTALSVTPSEPGPFYIYRNIIETNRRDTERLNSGFALKSGVNSGDLAQNVKVYNNSFYSNLYNVWEKTNDAQENDWDGYDFVNNVFYARSQNVKFRGLSEIESGPMNFWSHNLYNKSPALSDNEEAGFIISENDADFYVKIPEVDGTLPNSLQPSPDSPAIDSGSMHPVKQGWPDSIKNYPSGINRGAWEDDMSEGDIGAS